MIFDPKIDPKTTQDRPKTDPRGSSSLRFSMLIFAFDFGPFWAAFSNLLGSLVVLKIDPKSIPIFSDIALWQHTPKRPLQEAPRSPQEAPELSQDAPRGVQEAPKRIQQAPRGIQDTPRPLQMAPRTSPEAPGPWSNVNAGLVLIQNIIEFEHI